MTKEKLRKEASNWLRKYLLCCNCNRKCTCIQLNAYCEEQVLESYIAGAEPRQKRIQELESTNKKISDICHKLVNSLEDMTRIKAELKLKLEALEGQTPWKDIKDKSELIGKFIKATEIIEKLMVFAKIDNREYEEVYKEAEQFLKESK